MDFVTLIIGLVGLWLGTELTVRGAMTVASRLGVSEFVVGLAILSVGTDLPELAIAIDGAIENLHAGQTSDVVVGSALGSALGQIGFVLGIAALFSRLALPKSAVWRHGGVMLGSLVLLGFFALDGTVVRGEGITLIAVYLIYFVTLFAGNRSVGVSGGTSNGSLARAWIYLAVGLAVIAGAAELTVDGAIRVAETLGVEETLVAIVIVGLGTSLPELSISVGAALKKHGRLSVGNLIGSNIFDTLVPIGVAAAVAGITFDENLLRHELPFLLFLSVLVLLLFLRRHYFQKREALTVLAVYGAYVLMKFSGLM